MNDIKRTRQTQIPIGILLAVSALVLAVFYSFLFWRDNAAPVVGLTDFTSNSDGFLYRMERCWSNEKKLAVVGWIARARHGSAKRSVRVVVVDDNSGQARAMKTTQVDREDIRKQINQSFGDEVVYRNVGFSASLNLTMADLPIGRGALYVAYDDGEAKVILPIECRVGSP